MLAITTDSVKSLGLVAIVGVAVIGVLGIILVQHLIARLVTIAVTLLLALLLWGQRSSLADCAKKVKANAPVVGTGADATCSFFGIDIRVPMPKAGTGN